MATEGQLSNVTVQKQSKRVTKSSNMLYVHYVIGLIIMFGAGFMPAVEPLTPLGMQLLGIFIALAYLWSVTDGIWASLLGLIAISTTGYAPFNGVIAGAFGNNHLLVIFFSLLLIGAIIVVDTPKYVAHFFLTRRIIDGRPLVFTYSIMFGAFILAAMTDAVASILMFWPIVYSILGEVGYKKGDKYSTLSIMGVFFAACLGSAVLPFKGAIVIIVSAFEAVAKQPVNLSSYILICVFAGMFIMFVYCLMMKYIFRADMSKMKAINSEMFRANPLPPMNKAQKITLYGLLGFVLGVVLPSILPVSIPGVAFLKGLGAAGVALLVIAILLMVRVDGQPILNFKQVVHQGMQWNVYFMVATAVYISKAMTSEGAGILPFVQNILNPILGGNSEFMFSVILIVFGMLITSFMHNGVLGTMLMPILFAFSSANGYNAMAIAVVLTMAINISFLTPAASVYAPLLHANREWLTTKEIFTYGGIFFVLTACVQLFINLPIANILF